MSLAAVREKLAIARNIPGALEKTFGASSHRFALNAPASIDAVVGFERWLGVPLPAGYRAFLLELGDGGAGPFYGVFPLGAWDEGELRGCPLIGSAARPFPHVEEWNWPEERLEALAEDDSGKLQDEYWRPMDGAIPVCHEGCALRDWLVVTGPEAGNVWHDATADMGGWFPWQSASRTRLDFVAWYEAWLDAAIAGKRFRPRNAFAWAERRRIDDMLGR